MILRITIMILEFVIENYRIIAVVLTLIGVVFCTYALIKQRENNKKIRNAVIRPGANITNISISNHENQILHNNNTGNPDITNINYPNNKKKKSTGIIFGVGIGFIIAAFLLATFVMLLLIIGIILFVVFFEFLSRTISGIG